ncbi:MAG TPA: cytochrome c oxidase assembly protein, partial [Thermoleophilaceae bacterium]|nr:cytochrome c oxidase assembly protein [Thermoleophilaceae bacterium]
MSFSFDPYAFAYLAVGVTLYVRAVRIARGRGLEVTTFQQCAFYGGVALWAIAIFSPVHSLSEDLLSAHMAQHLLIAELGGPLILVGLRAPVIYFFLPKPAMVWLARRRGLRRVMRRLTSPLGAIATYA